VNYYEVSYLLTFAPAICWQGSPWALISWTPHHRPAEKYSCCSTCHVADDLIAVVFRGKMYQRSFFVFVYFSFYMFIYSHMCNILSISREKICTPFEKVDTTTRSSCWNEVQPSLCYQSLGKTVIDRHICDPLMETKT
jgi:hypothetical protein